MVLTAFRGAAAGAASSLSVVQTGNGVARLQNGAPALEYALAGSPAFSEDIATAGPSFEREAEHSIPFEAHEGFRFDFVEDEDLEDRIHIGESDMPGAETSSSQHGEEFSGGFVLSTADAEPELDHHDAEPDNPYLVEPPDAFTCSAVDEASIGAISAGDRSEAPDSIVEAAVTDPWEAPLPAWDCSQSEWQVLVGPNQQESHTKRKALIAAVILMAGAAGFNFLVYRASTPGRGAATDYGATAPVSDVAESRGSAARPKDPDAGTPAPSVPAEAPSSAAAKPAEAAASGATASNEYGGAQGKFSLQAAAFPTLGGAEEFAEKLKRAGVPSYVVPADLARRGRWFRVRVGRFNGAEDAQRFAGEAQQRARTAGISLALIVCQYDQP